MNRIEKIQNARFDRRTRVLASSRYLRLGLFSIVLALSSPCPPCLRGESPPPVSDRAARVHDSALLFDGHNDLPWRLREAGDVAFTRIDIGKRLDSGHTDIPRLRQGGVKAQFWSVYIPSEHPNPARTVTQQIDLVHRMIERYPADFELATTAADVERIARAGKIASLIGIEGGVAIEDDLAQLRAFARLGARYMTLTHGTTLDWADSATDEPKSDGLSPFGERVVREMNRLGMLVDISHVSPATMADVLRVSQAPVIASHSGAFALCPSPRNVPDEVLRGVAKNGGVVMVNFYSGFLVAEAATMVADARRELKARFPDPKAYEKALDDWFASHTLPRGGVADVADHIDHIAQVAGIDHVGIGSDFDGIVSTPVGLEDVSCYPRLTEELLRRGHSEADVRQILGGNVLRAFREAGRVAEELRETTPPDVEQSKESAP
ncbi:MAG TPA: dipeptidase [Isosphaeraceae bacterium]